MWRMRNVLRLCSMERVIMGNDTDYELRMNWELEAMEDMDLLTSANGQLISMSEEEI